MEAVELLQTVEANKADEKNMDYGRWLEFYCQLIARRRGNLLEALRTASYPDPTMMLLRDKDPDTAWQVRKWIVEELSQRSYNFEPRHRLLDKLLVDLLQESNRSLLPELLE